MAIQNCMNCRRLFENVFGEKLCPACTKALDEKFKEVKNYIYDNPGASVKQVSDEMEVSIRQIERWVREERLEFNNSDMTGITCERCGHSISTGKYCENCKKDLVHSFSSMYQDKEAEVKKASSSNKMRFL